MKKLITGMLFITMLSGCAHTVWVKDGATQADLYRDESDCLVKANQAGYSGGSFGDNIRRNRFIQMCMFGGGWVSQKDS